MIRIATYNMRQGGSFDNWSQLLERMKPDVVCAQETKDPNAFKPNLFDRLDFRDTLWRGVPGQGWGSALWVQRTAVEEVLIPGFEGWVVGGRVRLEGIEFNAFSVHLDRSEGTYIRTAHRLLDTFAKRLDGAPVILAGDWNLTVGLRQPDEVPKNRSGEAREPRESRRKTGESGRNALLRPRRIPLSH